MRVSVQNNINLIGQMVRRHVLQAKLETASHKIDN